MQDELNHQPRPRAAGMPAPARKPRLLFLQFEYEPEVPEFLLIHKREHVACLSHSFDVTVVSRDCDYGEVCERHEPDLVLFEVGLELKRTRRLNIANIGACPDVPRLALMNADACTEYRAGILSDLEHWRIDTPFSISVSAAEHLPDEVARRLFIWPNSIDPQVYRDYGTEKLIPVLITGSQSPRYPWRNKVSSLLAKHYPSLICPHAGYVSNTPAGRMLYGEKYARVINTSMFVPACGSVVKELVRKHFEIPGSSACLITERSPALEAAGFVDMHNCVFADDSDVLDKVSHLLHHPQQLSEITRRGHQLVHERHTSAHRDQIYQWFSLHTALAPGQRIVQRNYFDALELADVASVPESFHLRSGAAHLELLRSADKLFDSGKYGDAMPLYLRTLVFASEFPEPKLKLALCCLHDGNPRQALSWIIQPLRCTLAGYGAEDADPVEWAYFILCLVALGRMRSAVRRAKQFPVLRHPELDRVRLAVSLLTDDVELRYLASQPAGKPRSTIHSLRDRDAAAWLDWMCEMLSACGRAHAAVTLRERARAERPMLATAPSVRARRTHAVQPRRPTLSGLDHPQLLSKVAHRILDGGRKAVHRLLDLRPTDVRRTGAGQSEVESAIGNLTARADVTSALVVGAGDDGALPCAAHRGSQTLLVRVVPDGPGQAARESCGHAGCRSSIQRSDFEPRALDSLLHRIKAEARLQAFDAFVLGANGLPASAACAGPLLREARRARYALVWGIDSAVGYLVYRALAGDSNFRPTAIGLDASGSYASFERFDADRRINDGAPPPLAL